MTEKKRNNQENHSENVEGAERCTFEPAADEETQSQAPDGPAGGDAAASPEEPGDETDDLGRARAEAVAWKDKFLRAKAEQQNVARRAANQIEEAVRYANADLLRVLLEVVDDFDRTLEAARRSDSIETVVDGLQLVREKLNKLLRDHHVEAVEAENTPFDPTVHEALMQQPSADHGPGMVIQQVQRGYKLRDRVLRPAKVIVSGAPTTKTAEDNGG